MENQGFFKQKAAFSLLILIFATISYGSYDVSWTFGNVGSFSYKLDAFSPAEAVLGAAIGTEDPTLNLSIGKRYQIKICAIAGVARKISL